MAQFVPIEVQSDPEGQQAEIFELLASVFPGWEPNEGNLETWFVIAVSHMVDELRSLAADIPDEIFKQFGATIIGLPPLEAAAATGESTWTMIDNAGYTIPQGTLVSIAATGSELIGFEVQEDVVVPPGSTVTAVGEVILVAVEEGEESNGLTADPELDTNLDYIEDDGIALEGTTSGGADAETSGDYLDRLTTELQLLTPRPILADDFAVLAQRVAEVGRATAIDGFDPDDPGAYDPDNPATWKERTVAVAVIDEAGANLTVPQKAEVDALLEAERELNFIVKVMDPTRTAIDVTVVGRAFSTFDPVQVDTDVTEALQEYLSPAKWGVPPFGESTAWINTPKVRYLEVAEAINRVAGLDYIESLTVEGGTADVDLAGVVSLAEPGVITVTINSA